METINRVRNLVPITGSLEVDQMIAAGRNRITQAAEAEKAEEAARMASFEETIATRRREQEASIKKVLPVFLHGFLKWDETNAYNVTLAIEGLAPILFTIKDYEDYVVNGPFLPDYTAYFHNKGDDKGKKYVRAHYDERDPAEDLNVALARAVDLERERLQMEDEVRVYNLGLEKRVFSEFDPAVHTLSNMEIMGQVWDLDLPHKELWVLFALGENAGHLDLKRLAWLTGYGEYKVSRLLNRLESRGLIACRTDRTMPAEYDVDFSMAPKKPAFRRRSEG